MVDARPAGFWIRAAAAVLDLVLLTIVERSFFFVARLLHGVVGADAWSVSSTVTLFTLVFACLYATTLHAFGGQTLGKLLVGVRVVALEGQPLLLGQAFLRWLAYGVSLAPVGLGFAMAGWRHDRRALHDLLAGTRVERVPAFTPSPPNPPRESPVELVSPTP